jgi:hypothetical protein
MKKNENMMTTLNIITLKTYIPTWGRSKIPKQIENNMLFFPKKE